MDEMNKKEKIEESAKEASKSNKVYDIVIVILVAVLLFSGFMLLWNQQIISLFNTQTAETTENINTGAARPTKPAIPTDPTEQTDPPILVGEVDIRLNEHSAPVCLIGQGARDYLAAEDVSNVTDFLAPYRKTENRMDRGVPVKLSYTVYSLPKDVMVTKAVFCVFSEDGLELLMKQEVDADRRSIQVYNLRTNASYQYQVEVVLSDGTRKNLEGYFQTAAGPRLMNIDGLVNVRDLGGWVTVDGKTVGQGILYRGSELDGTVEKDFHLTENGLKELQSLGIRAELDLRHDGEDMLGSEVEHIYYDLLQYELAFTPAGMEAIRRVFADLANPDRYPVYLHCTYGADRTGTVCYLLLGLLGVDAADLMREYELTALYYGFVSSEEMEGFVRRMTALPGETMQERVKLFLLSAGVTQEQIDSIYQIFLE